MSDRGGQSDPSETGRGSFWTSLPGILTGLAALITAVVGLMSILPGNDDPGAADAASPPAPAVSQPAASQSTDPAPTSSTPGVFAEGRIAMRTPDNVDLETGLIGNPPGYDLYLHCSAVSACILNAMGSLMTIAGDSTDKESCIAALKTRRVQALETPDLREGQALCIQTTDGHVGRLQLLGVPGPGSADLEFTYTLWL